ncbi:MAG: pyridoxal-dependent decarboxylase, partial [Brevibacterium aurantiacum]|nr:pyridoxal-dependent decarboxylase [Brevibacterium aurantiacum]
SSIASAAAVMDVDVAPVPTGDDGILRPEGVRAALDEHGDAVIAVVATSGTTNFGTIDDIAGIAALKEEFDFWLHIDGAYGLAAMLSPVVRHKFAGVESADSVIVDPHKWLFAPFDACALIYRDPTLGRRAHTQRAEYLDTLTESQEWSPSDYAIQLTRRPRGLPLWYSLASYGAETYREAIGHSIELARQIGSEIKRRPNLKLVREPELSVVVFERVEWSREDYQQWSDRLLEDQRAFVVPSSHQGRPNARFAIVNPLTTFEDLVDILDTMG